MTHRRAFLQQVSLGAAGLGLFPLFSGCRSTGLHAGAGLPRSTPEAQGISSAGIQGFFDALAGTKHEFHSIMVVRHGHVVAEGWWAPYAPALNHTLYSMSKSFTSTAIGFAVAEGKLTVDDRVVSFFPDDLPAQPSEYLKQMRIKDLLEMAAGHGKEPTWEMIKQENWPRFFLAWPIDHPPGTNFLYNSACTYMCSAIVQKVTGQHTLDYLRPRLFDPLGIEGMTWDTCPRGMNVGGWGLSLRTEGLAKFGELYLQRGMWKGRQIIPAAWVDEGTSFKIQQPAPAHPARPKEQDDWQQGYCYQFWRSTHHAYRGDGAFGQYTIVLPEKDAVIAITSETSNMQGELDLVWEHLLAAMADTALPPNPTAQARLAETVARLELKHPEGRPSSPLASRHSGHTFALESNDLGLRTAQFQFNGADCGVVFADNRHQWPIRSRFGKWQQGETTLPGTPPDLVPLPPKSGTTRKIASAAAWRDDNTLEIIVRYIETPHHDVVTCRFDGSRVRISFMNSIAAMSATPKDKRPVLDGKMDVGMASADRRSLAAFAS